jgi:hypothetical protein
MIQDPWLTFSVLVKTVHTLVENADNCKIQQLKLLCVETLAVCGTTLPYKTGLKTIILQDLNYLEHLGEFNAEVLAMMSQKYDDSSMLDNILQYCFEVFNVVDTWEEFHFLQMIAVQPRLLPRFC